MALVETLYWLFGNEYNNKTNTFCPKNYRISTKRYELHKYSRITLGTGNLRDTVILPKGEDINEWLAVHIIDFFNEINLLYSIISEFCTDQTCPIMCAGPKYQYMWADKNIRIPIAVSAPKYVNLLMTWVENQINDEELFPTKLGVPFPPNFMENIQNIIKRLFRVYTHIYYCHFEKIQTLGAEPHLNTSFKHFMYFVNEFKLIPDCEQLEPLQELINNLMS